MPLPAVHALNPVGGPCTLLTISARRLASSCTRRVASAASTRACSLRSSACSLSMSLGGVAAVDPSGGGGVVGSAVVDVGASGGGWSVTGGVVSGAGSLAVGCAEPALVDGGVWAS